MRNATILFLIVTFFIHSFGYLIFSETALFIHHEKIERELRTNPNPEITSEFNFSKAEYYSLNWKEKNEFEFQGKMYDVYGVKFHNGKFKVSAIQDEKEEKLAEDYRMNLEKKWNENLCLVSFVYVLSNLNLADFLKPDFVSEISLVLFKVQFSESNFSQIQIPPPELK